MRDARARLEDILDAIESIEKYAARGQQTFIDDELVQNWILRHLQIIGEAVSRLRQERPDWLAEHPTVQWDEVIGMRNRLVHDYGGIRLDRAWAAVETGLPAMKRTVAELLAATD